MNDVVVTGLALLRAPFPQHQISKLPKPKTKDAPKGRCAECGGWHGLPAVHLDYVGHAALTDRLLDADPAWFWEPLAMSPDGLPVFDGFGGMWIRLTVCGVTRLGYGDSQGKDGPNAIKEAIGDALRNSAMRFGAALDLWHKGDLHAEPETEPATPQAPEIVPMSETNRADWLAAIATAGADELEALGKDALEAATKVKDRDAFVAFRAGINKRKATLKATA